jgi:hypothetical protein
MAPAGSIAVRSREPWPVRGQGSFWRAVRLRSSRGAEEIRSAGGVAETRQLDALDQVAVDEHADAVVAEAGSLDISFNLISHDYVQERRWPRWSSRATSSRSSTLSGRRS